jgi:hypothetical protein
VAANPEIVAGVLDPSLRLPPWVVAPGFTWRRSGTGGLAELRAAVPIDERGLGGTVDARLDRGRWDAFAQANGRVTDRIDDLGDLVDLATAGLGFKSDPVELRASWIFADNAWLPQNPPDVRDLHQARWAMGVTPPFLAVLRVDGAVAHSLDDGTIQQRAVGLAYAHPTDCLIIGARGWWDADRVFPEVSIRADVRL